MGQDFKYRSTSVTPTGVSTWCKISNGAGGTKEHTEMSMIFLTNGRRTACLASYTTTPTVFNAQYIFVFSVNSQISRPSLFAPSLPLDP